MPETQHHNIDFVLILDYRLYPNTSHIHPYMYG